MNKYEDEGNKKVCQQYQVNDSSSGPIKLNRISTFTVIKTSLRYVFSSEIASRILEADETSNEGKKARES